MPRSRTACWSSTAGGPNACGATLDCVAADERVPEQAFVGTAGLQRTTDGDGFVALTNHGLFRSPHG